MTAIKSISKAAKRVSRFPANVKNVKLTKEGVEPDTGSERFSLQFEVVRGTNSSRRTANYVVNFRTVGKNVIVDQADQFGVDALESDIRLVDTFDVLRDLVKAKRFFNSDALSRTSGINVPVSSYDPTQIPRLELVNKALIQACALQLSL